MNRLRLSLILTSSETIHRDNSLAQKMSRIEQVKNSLRREEKRVKKSKHGERRWIRLKTNSKGKNYYNDILETRKKTQTFWNSFLQIAGFPIQTHLLIRADKSRKARGQRLFSNEDESTPFWTVSYKPHRKGGESRKQGCEVNGTLIQSRLGHRVLTICPWNKI